MTPRNQTGQRILHALADGPLKDDDLALKLRVGIMGVISATRSLITDGSVSKVMGKPGFYRLVP